MASTMFYLFFIYLFILQMCWIDELHRWFH